MSKPGELSEAERADLVAYLDGESSGEARRAIEAKLNSKFPSQHPSSVGTQ